MLYNHSICVIFVSYLLIEPVLPWDRGRVTRAGLWKYLQRISQKSSLGSCCVRCQTWKNNATSDGALFNTEACHSCEGCCMIKGGMLVVGGYFGTLLEHNQFWACKFLQDNGEHTRTKTCCKYLKINPQEQLVSGRSNWSIIGRLDDSWYFWTLSKTTNLILQSSIKQIYL